MARPWRLVFPGTLYHLTDRGNAQQDTFLDAMDRERGSETGSAQRHHIEGVHAGRQRNHPVSFDARIFGVTPVMRFAQCAAGHQYLGSRV